MLMTACPGILMAAKAVEIRNTLMKRLFIIDPSLKDLRGHHYALTLAATQSAQLAGFKVIWLCSAEYTGDLAADDLTVDPVFRSTMYQQYILPKMAKSRVQLLLSRLWPKKNTGPNEPFRQEHQFVEDLKISFARHNAGAQDRALIHTAEGVVFRALAPLLLGEGAASLPRFHVATPYNPTGIMPNDGIVAEIDASVASLREAGVIGSRLFLYGENAPLAEHLAAHWSTKVRPLGLPMRPPAPDTISAAKAYRRETLGLSDNVFLVVSLGSARLEKGFDRLPAIIRETFALIDGQPSTGPRSPQIKYLLHASPQIIGRHPTIAATIDELTAMPHNQVELILDPLSDVDYERLLLASDAVIMPYSQQDYEIRGSMIVSEAIMADKLIVATADTYPGYAASKTLGRTARTPHEFAEAVLAISSDGEETRRRAQKARKAFAEENAVETYWKKCLDAESEGKS